MLSWRYPKCKLVLDKRELARYKCRKCGRSWFIEDWTTHTTKVTLDKVGGYHK